MVSSPAWAADTVKIGVVAAGSGSFVSAGHTLPAGGVKITDVFVLGSALAGLGGALLIGLFPVTPLTGGTIVMKGFTVALIGGVGNVGGAVVAGAILGLVEGFSAGYGFSEWTDAYSFGLMILAFLIRPSGLFGGMSGPRVA